MEYELKAVRGTPIDLPEGKGTLEITDFQKNFRFGDMALGETYIGQLNKNGQTPAQVVLPLQFPRFDMMRQGDLFISVAHLHEHTPIDQQRYYTGLQVTRDPGVLLVYGGFIVMIAGCFMTFFMFHQQICVEIIESKTETQVVVSGFANKNKMGMQRRTQTISERLRRL
jgi:cytochrome c biogenesis protein